MIGFEGVAPLNHLVQGVPFLLLWQQLKKEVACLDVLLRWVDGYATGTFREPASRLVLGVIVWAYTYINVCVCV
jgi:hypothetical protein